MKNTAPLITCVGWSRPGAAKLQAWEAEVRGNKLVSLVPFGGDGYGEDTGNAAVRVKREVALMRMKLEPRHADYVKQIQARFVGEHRGESLSVLPKGDCDLVGFSKETSAGADDLYQVWYVQLVNGAITQCVREDIPTPRHLAVERVATVFFKRLVQKLVRGDYDKVPPEIEKRASLERELAAAETRALTAGEKADAERARLEELRQALVSM